MKIEDFIFLSFFFSFTFLAFLGDFWVKWILVQWKRFEWFGEKEKKWKIKFKLFIGNKQKIDITK